MSATLNESSTAFPPSSLTGHAFDLEAYCQRIGYTGVRSATLSTLQAMHALHPQAIPFENLNPFLCLPVQLDMTSIQQKLVHGGRGGYCFEHNLLLGQALQVLGFQVTGLAARVVWNAPAGVLNARGHMLLLVEADGEKYIADVGFGGLTLTTPLRLEADRIQPTTHEPFRLVRFGEEYVLEALVREAWKPLYRFTLHQQLLPDYEMASWYLSNHPDSHFVTGVIAAKVAPDRRYALRNREFAVHHLHGETEHTTLESAMMLRSTLENTFGIRLVALPGVDTALAKLF